MNLSDYNGSTICRVLGLPELCDPAWAKDGISAMRVILKPSFHPEVVITLEKNETCVRISVIVAREMIWQQITPQPTRTFREEFESDKSTFLHHMRMFDTAVLDRMGLAIDGMAIEGLVFEDGKKRLLNAHIALNKPAREFARHIINCYWEGCKVPEIKNALAETARYVDLKIPRVPCPNEPSKQSVNLMILGTSDERDDFLKSVKKVGKGKKP
jgi:hypothetical protein